MSAARVTALVPLKHYQERFLRACFASLVRQTSDAWHCLVIVEARELAHFRAVLADELVDPRIQVIVNEGRKLAGAINTGIRRARTDFVALLLGDDLWAPNAVEVLTNAIEASPEVDFFHTARRVVDADGKPLTGVLPSCETFTVESFIDGSPVKHLLCFRRAKAIEVGGLDESLDRVGPDDYDFTWTMAERGAVFRALQEPLYVYRDHREGYRLTTHLPLSVHTRQILKIMRKHGVGWRLALVQVFKFRRGYLRQCLFRNSAHRWLSESFGYDPKAGWHDYR
jgi:glycosyltransferase involved in cell wall biosynthesis